MCIWTNDNINFGTHPMQDYFIQLIDNVKWWKLIVAFNLSITWLWIELLLFELFHLSYWSIITPMKLLMCFLKLIILSLCENHMRDFSVLYWPFYLLPDWGNDFIADLLAINANCFANKLVLSVIPCLIYFFHKFYSICSDFSLIIACMMFIIPVLIL